MSFFSFGKNNLIGPNAYINSVVIGNDNILSYSWISNSEIVNFNKVENIDFKILGTLIINFKSGNKSYASRRYIPKIKEFLEI